MEPKRYRVSRVERTRVEAEAEKALADAFRNDGRRRGYRRAHYDSLEAILDGEEISISRTLRGRIVA